MQLYLIRHAQSGNNAKPEEQRVPDPGITELGHRQAAAVAGRFRSVGLTHLVTSAFRRALETTEHIRRAVRLTPEIWTPLHEQGGCYSGYLPNGKVGQPGMTANEIAAEFPDYSVDASIDENGWWKSRPYESINEARLRADMLIAETIQRFGSTNSVVAYVVHADFKRILTEQMLTQSRDGAAYDKDAGIYNTAVSRFHISGNDIGLDLYNCVSHLPESTLST
jgi:2,3-bisphosphoglycerate-dependent phosphoglycerate mutase